MSRSEGNTKQEDRERVFSLVHQVSVILNILGRKLSVQSDPWVVTTVCTTSWGVSTAQMDEDATPLDQLPPRGNQILDAESTNISVQTLSSHSLDLLSQ